MASNAISAHAANAEPITETELHNFQAAQYAAF